MTTLPIKPDHTPLPWRFDDADDYLIIGKAPAEYSGKEITICLMADADTASYAPYDRANAQFIVRACNAYHDLVAAVTGLLRTCELNLDDLEGDTRYQIENALAVLKAAGVQS